jgi:integrase
MTLFRRGETWWYKFQFRGLEIRESAHTKSRTRALKAERARRNQLDEGAAVIKARKAMLFAQAAREYLEIKSAHWQPSTRSAETYNVNHLAPHFGRKLLTDITADQIARYQTARKEEGAAAKTINLETATLRAILRKHRLWAAIQPDVRPLAARTDIGRALSKEEERKLLTAAAESRSRGLYPAILLSIHTGLRNKELRTLRWQLVNLIDGCITVGVSKTRGGEGRVVPLSAVALSVMREWRANFPEATPDHFVFPSERVGLRGEEGYLHGRTVAYDVDPTKPIGSWKVAFSGAMKKAGFRCRWHDLRHTFVSRCAEGGAPEQTLIALGGWMSRKMLETYSHTRMEAKRRAVAVFDAQEVEAQDDAGVGTKQGTVQ